MEVKGGLWFVDAWGISTATEAYYIMWLEVTLSCPQGADSGLCGSKVRFGFSGPVLSDKSCKSPVMSCMVSYSITAHGSGNQGDA